MESVNRVLIDIGVLHWFDTASFVEIKAFAKEHGLFKRLLSTLRLKLVVRNYLGKDYFKPKFGEDLDTKLSDNVLIKDKRNVFIVFLRSILGRGHGITDWSDLRLVNLSLRYSQDESLIPEQEINSSPSPEQEETKETIYPSNATEATIRELGGDFLEITKWDTRLLPKHTEEKSQTHREDFATGASGAFRSVSLKDFVFKNGENEFQQVKLIFETLVKIQDVSPEISRHFSFPLGYYYDNNTPVIAFQHCGYSLLLYTLTVISDDALLRTFTQIAAATSMLNLFHIYHGDLFARNVCTDVHGDSVIIDYDQVQNIFDEDVDDIIHPLAEFFSFVISVLRLRQELNTDASRNFNLLILKCLLRNDRSDIQEIEKMIFSGNHEGLLSEGWFIVSPIGARDVESFEGFWPNEKRLLFRNMEQTIACLQT